MQIPFVSSTRSSLGVEWELELVDPASRELASVAGDVLADLADGPTEHPKAKHELLESTVEIITGVCAGVDEALGDLAGTLTEVTDAAAGRGAQVMCSGTHPFTDWAGQPVSPDPRYARFLEEKQWPARQLQVFGVHVHVGVRSPEKVMPIVTALTAYLPHLVALSSSSPYWMGRDTGLASARSTVFGALPTTGLPEQLASWPAFEGYLQAQIAAGTVQSVREVWWDIRPHPGFGTVELRMCDGLSTLREVGMIAALGQCLVEQMDSDLDRGEALRAPEPWLARENKWRAVRYGLEAREIVDSTGLTRPLRESLVELVEFLGPAAERLGCTDHLGVVAETLAGGTSSTRQRAAAGPGTDLTAVVDHLLAEMAAGRPLAAGV